MSVPRVLVWFSCGDASAVAGAMALQKYRDTHEVVVARIVIPAEHEDNDRFAADCVRWFDSPITELRSDRYSDTWDVWTKRRYIQRPTDIHVFGYCDETNDKRRADNLRKTNFELTIETPLIEAGLSKNDCHSLVRARGIELPLMYRLGYKNNNCVGCVKGGSGYWNMIRRDFPAVFDRMAILSREIGCRLVKQDGERIFLDQLRPTTGKQYDDLEIDCSAHCEAVAFDLGLEFVSNSASPGLTETSQPGPSRETEIRSRIGGGPTHAGRAVP